MRGEQDRQVSKYLRCLALVWHDAGKKIPSFLPTILGAANFMFIVRTSIRLPYNNLSPTADILNFKYPLTAKSINEICINVKLAANC